jgi:LuxR family maltose regulon positive regulatory protein
VVAVVTRCRLGNIYQQQGRLDQAYQVYQKALEIATRGRSRPLPAACEALLGLGKIEWEWYRLENAAQKLREGLALSRQWRELVSIDGIITLAHLLLSQGKAAQAVQVMEDAREAATQKMHAETGRVYLEMHTAHLQVRQGQLGPAEDWARRRGLAQYLGTGELDEALGRGTGMLRALELGVYSRILLARKAYDQALALLDNLLVVLSPDRQRVQAIETHLLKAIAQALLGERPQALQSIEKALALAAPAGYRRIFLDEGPLALSLVGALPSRGELHSFAQEILALSQDMVPGGTSSATGLDEPLTSREIEVLGWLQSELPVPEIAARMHISTSTLRTHIRNIYRKLGVHSRFEAVSRVQDLNLV